MTGGIIQLVAYGKEDLVLTHKPQITFFKIMYRRHTNFAMEEEEHSFLTLPTFGGTYTCIVPRSGDLINRMALKICLPEIPTFQNVQGLDPLTKFAWARNIGHVLIKSVSLEINDKIIDKHYGEWMNIWSNLVYPSSDGFDKMIGNVPELYNFTNGKNRYILFIPLYFWFCRGSCLSLPIVAMQFCDIKLIVEFAEFNECHLISPTHSIECTNNIVNNNSYEYLYQQAPDGIDRFGLFVKYDIAKKLMYYSSVGDSLFIGETQTQPNNYNIISASHGYPIRPKIDAKSITHMYRTLKNINIDKVSLLINYVYLEDEERQQIVNTSHDYLIEQLYYTPNKQISGPNCKIKLTIDQPCKMLIWVTQLDYIKKSNDHYNYTDNHVRKTLYDNAITNPNTKRLYDNVLVNNTIGKSLLSTIGLMLNSKLRLNVSTNEFHEYVQPYQHSKSHLLPGVGMYSFALFPTDIQPSGTTNMSQIELIELIIRISPTVSQYINTTKKGKIRAYALCYNVMRIVYGLNSTVFTTKI